MPKHMITKPLTEKQLRAKVGPDNRLRGVFAIDLYELACVSSDGTLDGLNDYVDEHVWSGSPPLSDLNYKAVGVLPEENKVLIEVDADAAEVLADISDGEQGA